MKLLTNPAFMATVMLFVAGAAAFIIGVLLIRRMRRELVGNRDIAPRAESPAFAFEAYGAVIQQLKEKETELQRLRQSAADRASASENVSLAVLNNLPSGVVLFNTSSLVQQANPAAREILGYASAAGLHARDLFRGAAAVRGDAGLASLPEIVAASLKEGRVFRRLEVDYESPSASKRVLGITVSPVTASSGERLGVACLITDLTQVSQLSKQLRLRESLAAMGEMSAGMAHEFKNSLATIAGYSQMLADETNPETVRQFASRINDETATLTRTVTEFLNITRPQKLTSEAVAIAPLLQSCATDCGVTLESSIAPDVTVIGDPSAIRQCFLNLLRNSAEAAPERTVRVTATSGEESGRTKIELRDDAGGIPADVLPRVFIPFVTTKTNGNGLGLALAHRIVSDHGGAISASNEGPGALFTLSFPAEKSVKTAIE